MKTEMVPQNINPSLLRISDSRADQYIYPEAPKLTFWQKLGRGLGSFMNFAGPIASAATAFIPGFGLPLSAGIYGLTRFSQDQLYKAQMKDQIMMANQEQPVNVQMTGLFETAPLSVGEEVTDFMLPDELDATNVIIERNQAHQEELTKM